jgi:hypothetical protein
MTKDRVDGLLDGEFFVEKPARVAAHRSAEIGVVSHGGGEPEKRVVITIAGAKAGAARFE